MLRNFAKSEDGAVTVDWVVMTAAVVALAIFIISLYRGALLAEVATWFV